jgi:hypothetical protein
MCEHLSTMDGDVLIAPKGCRSAGKPEKQTSWQPAALDTTGSKQPLISSRSWRVGQSLLALVAVHFQAVVSS